MIEQHEMNCPVCGRVLEAARFDHAYQTCTTMYCPLFASQAHTDKWRFLTAAIDQQGDAVQEARKAIVRLSKKEVK